MSINPVYNDNKLKLGTFCTNGTGASLSLAPEANKMNWPMSVEAAKIADEAGLEAIVPFARWKGYLSNNPNHYSGNVLDPYIWAAAIAQHTRHASIFVTSHAPTVHPIMAARQAATIDIVSGGRLGLNVVGGWNRPELEMFGAPMKEHEERYDHLQEWLDIIKKLWASDEEFDHEGKFFKIVKGFTLPKPVQTPPPIMNAGGSDRGRQFACKNADMCFVPIRAEDRHVVRAEVDAYKKMAWDEFGRKIQVWTNSFVIQRDTQKDAEDFLKYFVVDHQDRECVDSFVNRSVTEGKGLRPEMVEALRVRIAAAAGGTLLVGTADHIVERLQMLSDAGIDGVLLTWPEYIDGLKAFGADVLPCLEQLGLRKKFAGMS